MQNLFIRLKRGLNNKKKFWLDKKEYTRLNEGNKDFIIHKKDIWECHDWAHEAAGSLDAHYFLQDLYIAKAVLARKPLKHYDIGSRIDGFIAHLLTQMEVTVIDVRPLSNKVDGLNFLQGDASNLKMLKDESVESLSSLHAVEHFGLGRYGDPVAPSAWKKALDEMQRVLAPKGRLYLSVPIGNVEKVCFNAHRVFHPLTIINYLADLQLVEFSYIQNMQVIHTEGTLGKNDYGDGPCGGACGLFIFEKK